MNIGHCELNLSLGCFKAPLSQGRVNDVIKIINVCRPIYLQWAPTIGNKSIEKILDILMEFPISTCHCTCHCGSNVVRNITPTAIILSPALCNKLT